MLVWYLLFTLFIPRLQTDGFEARRTLRVSVPAMEVYADRLEQGDCDLYGRGEWQITVRGDVVNDQIQLRGELVFSENAGDQTRISGVFRKCIPLHEGKDRLRWCSYRLKEPYGRVRGGNFGPTGAHWAAGEQLIKGVRVVTDTWTCEPGNVGGILFFNDLLVECDCAIAGL